MRHRVPKKAHVDINIEMNSGDKREKINKPIGIAHLDLLTYLCDLM
jgi:hypothetical protein